MVWSKDNKSHEEPPVNAAQRSETRARQFWQSVVVVWRLQAALLLLFARINNHVLTIAHKMKCRAEVKLSRILAPYFKNKYYSFTPLSCYDAKIPAAPNYQQRRASYGAKTVIMILDYGISLTHVCGLEFFNFYIDTHSIQKRPLPLFLEKTYFCFYTHSLSKNLQCYFFNATEGQGL